MCTNWEKASTAAASCDDVSTLAVPLLTLAIAAALAPALGGSTAGGKSNAEIKARGDNPRLVAALSLVDGDEG